MLAGRARREFIAKVTKNKTEDDHVSDEEENAKDVLND
jgi:hypothetical protein